jgi:hypothetical protein
MGHPSEYFVKFTLAQAWGDEDEDTSLVSLNKSLHEFGLPGMLESQYDALMADFKPPEGFRFNNKKHAPTKEYMVGEKISGLWRPNQDEKRVLLEVVDGAAGVRHDLHVLLLGNLPHAVVAEKLNIKWRLNPKFNEGMVDTYAHYFWNVGNTSQEDWSKLLEGKPHKDAFMAALRCGEQQALYRAGFSPRVDGNRALKEAHRQAYFRLEALRFEPDTKLTAEIYSKLTARMMGLHETLFSEGSGLQEQLKLFRQVMMKKKDPAVKAIDAIISKVGSYSEDGTDSEQVKGDQDDAE